MVLPTLPSYLELKKVNFNQDFLRTKHTNAFDYREKWSNASKYYHNSNNQANQHKAWTSDRSFSHSMNAYSKQQEESDEQKEQRIKSVKDRQHKLKNLITSESLKYEQELKELRISGKDNSNTLDSLKNRIDMIKSAREEDRKRLAEEKLYQSWRENNPEIRQLESKQFEKYVHDTWSGQMKEKQEAVRLLEEEDNEYLKYLEAEKQKAEDLDLELKRLKLNREIELKEILKQQMIELKQKEAESEILNREESDLVQEQYEMMKLNEERDKISQANAKQEYGRALLRQHKAKLRQKAKEIQDALELDLRILQMIADTQDKQKHLEMEKRLKAKADAEHMIQVLNQQLRLEKEREAELESMFQDEAAKEWDRRNSEWERERQARENLMKQVLNERQQQMNFKLNLLQQKKAESLQRREELVRDMEKTQALAIKEREKSARMKEEVKRDIESQITSRKETVIKDSILKDIDQYEQEQIKENQYKEFMNREKEKQVQVKFEPKSFGRKKVAWN